MLHHMTKNTLQYWSYFIAPLGSTVSLFIDIYTVLGTSSIGNHSDWCPETVMKEFLPYSIRTKGIGNKYLVKKKIRDTV